MGIRELLFSAQVLLLSVSANRPTYERVLPSGVKVTCDRCPPGTYFHAHCTGTRPTHCRPCPAGFYTEFWNSIPECLLCDLCARNQEETRSCAPSHNRVCQCADGYYWFSHVCKKHTVCAAGYGLKSKGTPFKDTECELCKSGYYAVKSVGGAQCVPHTACQGDEKLVIHGNHWHDNVCVTCYNMTTQGWHILLRPLLSELFAHHKHHRLQRFARHFKSELNITSNNNVLEQVQQWLSRATEKQVTELPAMLREVNIQSLADKVEENIMRFQKEATYCSNTIN